MSRSPLSNGAFDDGLAFWHQSGNGQASTVLIEDNPVAQLLTTTTDPITITQLVSTGIGALQQLQFDYRFQTTAGTLKVFQGGTLLLSITSGGVVSAVGAATTGAGALPEFNRVSLTYTNPISSATDSLSFTLLPGSLAEVQIDNVSLVAAETPPVKSLSALSPAKIWAGLKNSDDVGLRLDLRADVFLSATKIGEGQLNNVSSGSSGFSNALLQTIPLVLTGGAVTVPHGAQLKLAVSARRTCSGGGHSSGTPRLWLNGKLVDSGPGRDADSRFDATINSVDRNYFLQGNLALSTTAGSSRLFIDKSVNSNMACPNRPYTPFGTWTITLP